MKYAKIVSTKQFCPVMKYILKRKFNFTIFVRFGQIWSICDDFLADFL